MQKIDLPPSELLAILRGHTLLRDLPDAELDWLITHGRLWQIAAGENFAPRGTQRAGLYVLTKGQVANVVERGGVPRRLMEWRAGDISGTLPFSRMGKARGDNLALVESEALIVPVDDFPALIRDCPELTAVLVHVMVDRARHFVSGDLQEEKLVSLGKLAAGLAHELNNPASAAVRGAGQLQQSLIAIDEAARALCAAGLSEQEMATVLRMRQVCLRNPEQPEAPIERADREDAISEWLDAHGADPELAAPLAETGVRPSTLDPVVSGVPPRAVDPVLRWIAVGCGAQALARDIERAASRMHELVKAVKGFTYMDRSTDPEPVDVVAGLRDTIAVLGSKAKQKTATVVLQAESGLEPVNGFGGELNQVWSNLIDNALDAVTKGGEVMVSAERDAAGVVVRVSDNGPGIAPEVRPRVFEPFFTTKPVGHGTGLGLDIVQRVLRKHGGEVTVDSRPGHTEFRVTIPVGR